MTRLFYFVYNIVLMGLLPLFLLLALFNRKIRALLAGQFRPLPQHIVQNQKPVIWLHAASGGEFQQILPLQRALRSESRILILTVTSPSIYLKAREHPGFDCVCYVPWEYPWWIGRFVRKTKPLLMVNTRHDVWPNLYAMLKCKKVPTLLVNANLYASSARLRGFSQTINRIIFNQIGEIFTVSPQTQTLLRQIYDGPLHVAGDTRFDQILFRAQHPDFSSELLEGKSWFIFGSLLSGENEMVLQAVKAHGDKPFIIVPHETHAEEIAWWEQAVAQTGRSHVLRTDLESLGAAEIIIWNTVGELADVYRYGAAAYVGGGFGAGVHSVIEPAVYHIPVAYGPKYDILAEAIELAEQNIAEVIHNAGELSAFISNVFDASWRQEKTAQMRNFVTTRSGAAEIIVNHIENMLSQA